MVTCPECEAEIPIDEYEVDKGEMLRCPECDSMLEVINTSPLELELAADEDEDEEDWDE